MKSFDKPLFRVIARYHYIFVGLILAVMFVLCVGSMRQDSAIVDEVAHIPAGYSYIDLQDYRLNPEHPPLMKVLAAVPLAFLHLKFPAHAHSWVNQVNGEWDIGYRFIYDTGANVAHLLFWARLPIVLAAIGFGCFLYWAMRKQYGIYIALLSLFFYAFSPNIIAHSRYVTTDLGITATLFIALTAFGWFVAKPTWRLTWFLSVAIAGAQLAKFSGAVLYPFFAIMLLILFLTQRHAYDSTFWKQLSSRFVAACALSLAWVYAVYAILVWKMPVAIQQKLITTSLPPHFMAHLLTHLSSWPGGKPLAQFILGIFMVQDRLQGGNHPFFWGHIDPNGSPWYFPASFLLKTQLSFLILMLVVIITACVLLWKKRQGLRKLSWVRKYFFEVTLGLFILTYFGIASHSSLDLGVRYILPIYPPLFVLVALGIRMLWRRYIIRLRLRPLIAGTFVVLLGWYAAAAIWIYPSYLAYINELVGGPANGSHYFGDSNVDWGQDLVRFKDYLSNHPEIHTIAIDYFGGADLRYYFCTYTGQSAELPSTASSFDCSNQHRVVVWHAGYGPYTGQYFAVSETYLISAPQYAYLRTQKPIAEIGYSIYVYKQR